MIINETYVKRMISQNLREYINNNEFSMWYIAYYSEVSETTLRNYLKEKSIPSVIVLIKIAELFECSVNDLLGYDHREFIRRERIFDSYIDSPNVVAYFWDKVEQYMKEKRIFGLEALALESFMSSYTLIFDKENGVLPKLVNIIKLCDTLDCTPSDLLGY